MSDTTYTCKDCQAVSTPENRIQFATEFQCFPCFVKESDRRRETDKEMRGMFLILFLGNLRNKIKEDPDGACEDIENYIEQIRSDESKS